MADSPISSVEFQRDFRGANTPWRRSKAHDVKWSRGSRPSSGVQWDISTGDYTGSDKQKELLRPEVKLSERNHPIPKAQHNIVKARGNWNMPVGRVRSKMHAITELNDVATSRSLADMPLPRSPMTRGLSVSENILYSFDRFDTPGRPLTLDIFVKSTGRETERLVEKEYEVIDANGEPLNGKKARRNLRKTATDPGTTGPSDDIVEDEGFELV